MAQTGTISHTVAGELTDRMIEAGYGWWAAGENLGGGYRSLEEAFYFWYRSEDHRYNLLMSGITEIGIATAFDPRSPYRTFWALIMARPYQAGPVHSAQAL